MIYKNKMTKTFLIFHLFRGKVESFFKFMWYVPQFYHTPKYTTSTLLISQHLELNSINRSENLRSNSLETIPTSQEPGLTPLVNNLLNNSSTKKSISNLFTKTQSYSNNTSVSDQNPMTPPSNSELDSLGKVSDFVCPYNPNSNHYKPNKNIAPFFNLRKNKFLVAVPVYGPNNQMNGILESIALAIRLNRTFVLPKLYRHHADQEANHIRDNSEANILDPGIRISIKDLNKLLPTIFIEDLNKVCPGGPDVVFPSHDDSDWVANFNSWLRYELEVTTC